MKAKSSFPIYTFLLFLLLVGVGGGASATPPVSTVGMPAKFNQLVLPGSELEAIHAEDRSVPVVLRIAGVWPHGTAFRYDLVYYALEPGTFDLRKYLQRKDRTATDDLPPIPVEVKPVLPPGQIEPNPLESATLPWLGGYRMAVTVGFMLWTAGLVTILMAGRKKRRDSLSKVTKPLTIADRLRPLVEGAVQGTVSQVELAKLERSLIAYWQRRLKLEGHKPSEVFTKLRADREAGPLILQLEAWLHRPDASGAIDVAALLRPYQNLPADDLDSLRVERLVTA